MNSDLIFRNRMIRKNRPIIPKDKLYSTFENNGVFQICFRSRGCSNYLAGSCIMCDYGLGTNITKELIQELIGKEIKNFTVTTGDASNVTSDIEVTIFLSSSGCNNASIIYFATFAILAMVISFIKRKSFK